MRKTTTLLTFLLAAAFLAGCGGTETFTLQDNKAPTWIKDPDIVAEQHPNKVCGTGMSPAFDDPSLTRDVADQQAFAKIAEAIGAEVDSNVKRTTQATRTEGTVQSERETVKRERETRADMLIEGLSIEDRYVNDANTWFSLACLPKGQIDEATRNILEERLNRDLAAKSDADQ